MADNITLDAVAIAFLFGLFFGWVLGVASGPKELRRDERGRFVKR
jgi:hypothetical protein